MRPSHRASRTSRDIVEGVSTLTRINVVIKTFRKLVTIFLVSSLLLELVDLAPKDARRTVFCVKRVLRRNAIQDRGAKSMLPTHRLRPTEYLPKTSMNPSFAIVTRPGST